jgi:four helix bundle protein
MGKSEILSYRDLDVWRAAMELTVLTYEVARRLPEEERYGLSSQIRRAAVSIPSNVAEGQSCGEDGRYIHHVRTALGSTGELSTELEIVLRLKFASETDLAAVLQQLTRTRQLLFGLLRTLRKHRLLKRGRVILLIGACVWLGSLVVLG